MFFLKAGVYVGAHSAAVYAAASGGKEGRTFIEDKMLDQSHLLYISGNTF